MAILVTEYKNKILNHLLNGEDLPSPHRIFAALCKKDNTEIIGTAPTPINDTVTAISLVLFSLLVLKSYLGLQLC